MPVFDYVLKDNRRGRDIPIAVYLPDELPPFPLPVVIFSPGYRGVVERADVSRTPAYKNYSYLADYFIEKGHGFISIQHDLIGDTDGLETLDPSLAQHEAREHLFKRGMENILYVLSHPPLGLPPLDLQRFIIAGHSNGGDIAKYFANHYPERVSAIIVLDAQRCRIDPANELRLLMFEANDTTTDNGVLPDAGTAEHPLRNKLEWVVVKPKNALHVSYNDAYITEDVRHSVCSTISWFLG